MSRAGPGAALLAALCLLAGCGGDGPPRAPATQRTIVIGFDGLDPALTERWMADGSLPHFAALRGRGRYQRLATSNPPQSPVAWASFATGTDPGEHGIFDFLRRKPGSYEPDFSIAEFAAPEPVELLGMKLTLGDPQLRNRRHGQPLWLAAEARGDRATVLRVPVTYPPDPVNRMIAGMGVPDLLGTQGTYTLVATRPLPNAENGGRVLTVPIGEDGAVKTHLDGPPDPWSSSNAALQVPLLLTASGDGAQLTLGATTMPLAAGRWSDWIRLRYSAGLLGSVKGMTRAYLVEGFPRPLLYLAPIQADPADPALPISSPPDYAAELERRIGTYHTLGMPEETWALNQGHLGEQAWLDMVATTLREGEAMLYDALDRRDSELVVKVFVQTDRVSHMFWRGLDPAHPLHAASSETARAAIPNIYREADRVLGETVRRLGPGDRLIVLSDHGFAAFRASESLAGRKGLHDAQVRRRSRRAAVRLGRLVEDARLRARPQRHLRESPRARAPGHRRRRRRGRAQAGTRCRAGRTARSGRPGRGRARGVRRRRDLLRGAARYRAGPAGRLCAGLSRLLADLAGRDTGQPDRGQPPVLERRPLHRAAGRARCAVHVVHAGAARLRHR